MFRIFQPRHHHNTTCQGSNALVREHLTNSGWHRRIHDVFDSVGGKILNTALRCIALGARVVLCGAISGYDATAPLPGPSNYLSLLTNRATMQGFIVLDYVSEFPEAKREVLGWITTGKLKFRTGVISGLENAPRALQKLFNGSNAGKLCVQVRAARKSRLRSDLEATAGPALA